MNSGFGIGIMIGRFLLLVIALLICWNLYRLTKALYLGLFVYKDLKPLQILLYSGTILILVVLLLWKIIHLEVFGM